MCEPCSAGTPTPYLPYPSGHPEIAAQHGQAQSRQLGVARTIDRIHSAGQRVSRPRPGVAQAARSCVRQHARERRPQTVQGYTGLEFLNGYACGREGDERKQFLMLRLTEKLLPLAQRVHPAVDGGVKLVISQPARRHRNP